MDINELYEMARNGDEVAERRLFHELAVRFRVITHHRVSDKDDCDDIVQSALMTISSEFKSIEIHASFAAWAYRVLQNRILSYAKKQRAKTRRERQSHEDPQGDAVLEPDPLLELRIIECMRKISRFNTRYARILNLHYQGYTFEEICTKLNISVNNAYVVLSRARSMLELCLQEGIIE